MLSMASTNVSLMRLNTSSDFPEKKDNLSQEFLLFVTNTWNLKVADVKWDIFGFPIGNAEGPTFYRFQPHTHRFDLSVDFTDELLMSSHVSCYQTEIICIGKSDIG